MRLLPVSTAVLTTAAATLWPAAILATVSYRVLADLRSAAVAVTILAGTAAIAWIGVAELKQHDRRLRARERVLIRRLDGQAREDEHPSGPFSAVR